MKERPVHGGGNFRCCAKAMARGHAYGDADSYTPTLLGLF